jgi:hypothetical protein
MSYNSSALVFDAEVDEAHISWHAPSKVLANWAASRPLSLGLQTEKKKAKNSAIFQFLGKYTKGGLGKKM